MNSVQWFEKHLKASADALVWGAELVPVERRFIRPPLGFGLWPAARHVFHLFFYEENYALPSMRQWLDEPMLVKRELNEDIAWNEGWSWEELIERFQNKREEQIKLLPRFGDEVWQQTRTAIWGSVTLNWVLSKTYQHTAEHTSSIMQIALFWDI